MSQSYRFERFEVRPLERQVLVDGQPAAVGSRALDLLLALIERRGRLVSKSELMDVVWPGLVVEENNIQVQVSALRKLLGSQAIATIPGLGYRLTLPLAQEASGLAQPVFESAGAERSPMSANEGDGFATASTRRLRRQPALIGRDDDLAQLRNLVSIHAEVTIVGPGGIGKTRLAAAVIDSLEDDGITGDAIWVDLAPLSDPTLVPTTIAAALGLPLDDQRDPLTTLVAALRHRSMLVVLDNCEHLIEATASAVVALIDGTRGIRVLATSRAPLKVAGEQAYRLDPLSIPSVSVPEDTAEQYGAVALFIARARAADRRFEPSGANLGHVVEICRRLDGIPLALELAAARVPSLGVVNLDRLLDRRFQVLAGGGRTEPARHQTMRAAFDWSYDLLAVEERTVFRRLGVFAGGFTLDAARRVVDAEMPDEYAAVDALARLVDLSLVVAGAGDPPRYSLLETGRAYALDKLAEAAEADDVERRHAVYYRELIVAAYDHWIAGPEAEWLSRTRVELDNLRAALGWALGPSGDASTAIALAGSAMPVWLDLDARDHSECRRYVGLAVDRLDSTADATAEARLWFASGLLAPPTEGDVEVAAYERAVALYRHSRNDKALCLALIVLARTLIRTGDAESASRAFAEARRLLDVAGTPKLRGLYQHALGRQEYAAGNASLARDLFASALACFEQAGCEALALLALFDQGDAAWCLIDLDAAAASFEEAADRIRRSSIGNKRAALGRATGSLTGVLIEQGKFSEAVQVAGMVVPVPGDGNGERVFVALALRLALIGRYEDAGRLLGWVEGAYAPAHQLRDPNLQRMRPRLLAILAQHVEDRLQVLRAEGASANDEEAWRIAAWVE